MRKVIKFFVRVVCIFATYSVTWAGSAESNEAAVLPTNLPISLPDSGAADDIVSSEESVADCSDGICVSTE
jgi:hypothetical protein